MIRQIIMVFTLSIKIKSEWSIIRVLEIISRVRNFSDLDPDQLTEHSKNEIVLISKQTWLYFREVWATVWFGGTSSYQDSTDLSAHRPS